MLIKCPVCGLHVPEETAVEVPSRSGVEKFCSARCADEAGFDEEPTARPQAPRRILVAVDGSGPSLRAVEMAAALAARSGGEVRLLSVVDSLWQRSLGLSAGAKQAVRLGLRADRIEEALREDAQAQLERGRRICERAGLKCTTHVEVFELPFQAIARAAEQADLLVLGSRGLGAVSGAVLGSLSHRILGATRTPVLVVH